MWYKRGLQESAILIFLFTRGSLIVRSALSVPSIIWPLCSMWTRKEMLHQWILRINLLISGSGSLFIRPSFLILSVRLMVSTVVRHNSTVCLQMAPALIALRYRICHFGNWSNYSTGQPVCWDIWGMWGKHVPIFDQVIILCLIVLTCRASQKYFIVGGIGVGVLILIVIGAVIFCRMRKKVMKPVSFSLIRTVRFFLRWTENRYLWFRLDFSQSIIYHRILLQTHYCWFDFILLPPWNYGTPLDNARHPLIFPLILLLT